jgi:hypothetical protein
MHLVKAENQESETTTCSLPGAAVWLPRHLAHKFAMDTIIVVAIVTSEIRGHALGERAQELGSIGAIPEARIHCSRSNYILYDMARKCIRRAGYGTIARH